MAEIRDPNLSVSQSLGARLHPLGHGGYSILFDGCLWIALATQSVMRLVLCLLAATWVSSTCWMARPAFPAPSSILRGRQS
jgi:hypothetical protein